MPPVPLSHSSFPIRAYFFLFLNIFFWSIGPLFIKYFTDYYDAWTQNAFRYACAALMLLVWARLRGVATGGLTKAQWGKLMLVAVSNILLQVAFATSYYFIYPSIASLVMRVDILFVCGLSFLFFHDERQIVRMRGFQVGAALALTGLIAVVAGQDPELLDRLEITRSSFWIGIGCMITFAFFLALYTLAIKRLVRDVDPFVSFTNVCWITALGLGALMLIFGRPSDLWRAGGVRPLFLMWLSAFCCILVAHTALYAALREIKAVVVTTMNLLIPVLTCTFSALIYKDRLSGVQLLGGLAVICGAWLATMAQARVARADRRQEMKK